MGPTWIESLRNQGPRINCTALLRSHIFYKATSPGLLQKPGFLVELFSARMQWDADAVQRGFCGDGLALGVTSIELLAGVVVPQSLGDAVDEIFRLIGAGHPLCTNGQSLHVVCVAFIGAARNRIGGKEGVLFADRRGFVAGDRNQLHVVLAGKLGNGA